MQYVKSVMKKSGKSGERSKKMIKTDKVIYRTRTLEEYEWLMEKLEEAGFKWANGSLPTAPEEADNWEEYLLRTGICLDYKMISYGDFNYYKTESEYKDYEFIEVSDLMENEMKTEILDKLETMNEYLNNKLKELELEEEEEEDADEPQKITKIVCTTEVYFE